MNTITVPLLQLYPAVLEYEKGEYERVLVHSLSKWAHGPTRREAGQDATKHTVTAHTRARHAPQKPQDGHAREHVACPTNGGVEPI